MKKQSYYTKKQRNVSVFLLKKAKKEYYKNLDLHNVTDTKKVWKTVFGNKVKICNTISLIKKSIVISSEKALAHHSKSRYRCIQREWSYYIRYKFVDINNWKVQIKNHMDKIEKPNFTFNEIIKPFVVKEIKNLHPKKTLQSNDIPTKSLGNILTYLQQ